MLKHFEGVALLAAIAAAPAIFAQTAVPKGPSARAPTTSSAAGRSRSPSRASPSAATPACSPSRPTASSSRSAASSALPDPIPPEFAGFAGSIKINVLTAGRSPRVAQLSLHARPQRQRQGAVDAVGHLCEGSAGPGPHRLRISPYDPRPPRLGRQRDVPSDLRLLERRQQAAEDARREERAGQRRDALRQAAGRGVPARRPHPRSPTASTTTA